VFIKSQVYTVSACTVEFLGYVVMWAVDDHLSIFYVIRLPTLVHLIKFFSEDLILFLLLRVEVWCYKYLLNVI